ncbi:MAG: DJ-1/PfpI family protein [Spirochaetaceae bacterium]|jgi:4-methyl-5(b-hydroxyethyl)-thiazole monophosphate biosynthesis|nr:DJ-1/PfpI family protein [Spirochaetaceae bacterium]
MSKKVLLLLAEGFEEVEAITPLDYLRRAGIEVQTASIAADGNVQVRGSHGLVVQADLGLQDAAQDSSWDGVLLPGGLPGATHLAASETVGALVKALARAGKLVAAICASPGVVLFPLGLLQGRRFTCYPGVEASVSGATWVEAPVVRDGNLITSRGAGTAGFWAKELIAYLTDPATAQNIAASVLLSPEEV